jgi:murein DD-endopeptidase MepM/ murein hydrolase activator NlpD
MSCDCEHHEPVPARSALGRRAVLAGGLAVGAAPFLPSLARVAGAEDGTQRDFGFLAPQPKDKEYVRPMMFPVLPDSTLGKAAWSDTFLAPRGGGRRHEGQDLMGNKMLKLLACVDGTIVELRHQSGGNSLYLKGDDGWFYCYLHINNDTPGTDDGKNAFEHAYAAGLKKGDRVKKGQHLAYLGDSGNAEGSGAHCHFEIRMPHKNWYNASAVNAHYSLVAAEPAVLGGGSTTNSDVELTTTGPYVPFAKAEDFVRRQAIDFLGVTPTAAWVTDSAAKLTSGKVSADEFIGDLMEDPAWGGVVDPTIRLYSAYFLRRPDTSGLKYWVGKVRGETSLDAISQEFAGSGEFKSRYGRLGNAEFVKLIYENVFKRAPDNSGLLHWTFQLDHGKSRGWVMRQMCESAEYVDKTAEEIAVISAYLGLLGKSPSDGDLTGWATMARADRAALGVLVKQIRTSPEYRQRIAGL